MRIFYGNDIQFRGKHVFECVEHGENNLLPYCAVQFAVHQGVVL